MNDSPYTTEPNREPPWFVVLKRHSTFGTLLDRTFIDATEQRARQRANSLAYLHSCETTAEGRTITVHAEEYYKKPRHPDRAPPKS